MITVGRIESCLITFLNTIDHSTLPSLNRIVDYNLVQLISINDSVIVIKKMESI